jgi:hypothetical protein
LELEGESFDVARADGELNPKEGKNARDTKKERKTKDHRRAVSGNCFKEIPKAIIKFLIIQMPVV